MNILKKNLKKGDQAKLARHLDVSLQRVNNWHRSGSVPKPYIIRVAKFLGIDVTEML